MAQFAVPLLIASTAVSAIGAIQAGKDQKRAYDYNAQINERNAKANDQAADQLVLQNEVDVKRFRNDFDDLQASTSQAFRYNGWMADTGTPLKVALANAQQADEEVATMRYNAKVGKQELKEQGVQQRMQANLNRMYGRNAARAGKFKAMGSLLSGASSYAAMKPV